MNEQQLLLLGILFVVGFVAVFAIITGVERHRAKTTESKESTSHQEREKKDSKPKSPEQDNTRQDQNVPWYEVLGVDENAPLTAIQQAYRKQIAQYHPDKIAGMAEELRKLANLRTVEINEAYERAKQHAQRK